METYLTESIAAVLAKIDGVPEDFVQEFQQPAKPEHGDLATNSALRLAKALKKPPREIGELLKAGLEELPIDPARVSSVEVAGPGFLNFRFATDYLYEGLRTILSQGDEYGKSTRNAGKKALVEYVSANPTGPLTVGHGRNAVLGDTAANLLACTGYEVTREYYYNNAGRQMRVLAASVQSRYEALVDPSKPTREIESDSGSISVPEDFPEDGYQGAYIIEIAQGVRDEHGDALVGATDTAPFQAAAEKAIFADIETTLGRLGIHMDSFFNERDLYDNNSVWTALEGLRDLGFVYDDDGAVWFKTTEFGKEKDTVLVKSSGEPTYRLPDIAYHVNKMKRGFDLMVDVFGADHIATYPDVIKGSELLGLDPEAVKVVIYQFVTLVRSGKPVKMSTRKATYVSLDELMDEVGEDVTRYFFQMRSPNSQLEFDLDLAKESAEKNPVYYLQMMHARVCAILRKADEVGFTFGETPDLSLLVHPMEISLIKVLQQLPDVIDSAATDIQPHRLINYLDEVATAFSRFYGSCRIVGEETSIASARMALADAARTVLKNGLTILGISAPEKM